MKYSLGCFENGYRHTVEYSLDDLSLLLRYFFRKKKKAGA